MKKLLPSVLAAALALSALGLPLSRANGAASVPAQDDPAEETDRITKLEEAVATLQSENARLTGLVEEMQTFIEKQAASADALLARLDESEELGFTNGINPRSREVAARRDARLPQRAQGRRAQARAGGRQRARPALALVARPRRTEPGRKPPRGRSFRATAAVFF